MADGDAHCHPVAVVGRPAELVNQRGEEQRRIGHPARNDDVSALSQRCQNRFDADIGVRGYDAVAERGDRLAVVEREIVFEKVG